MEPDKVLKYIKNKKFYYLIKNIGKITINKPLYNNNYLIHYAGENNHLKLLKTIIKNKGNISVTNSFGNTVAHIVATNGYNDLFEHVIKLDNRILNKQNLNGETPLHLIKDNYTFVKKILKKIDKKKVDLNIVSENDDTLFSSVVNSILDGKNSSRKDGIELLEFLINRKVDIDATKKRNPLILSVIRGDMDMVKFLVNNGANINVIDHLKLTPLLISIVEKKMDITKFLLDKGADYNYSTDNGKYFILVSALRYGSDDMINHLLEYDINMSFVNKYLDTPAHYVFMSKSDEYPLGIKRKILKKTDDVTMSNIDGNNILHLVLKKDNWVDYKDILKKKKLDIYSQNGKGERPIDYVKKNEMESFLDLVVDSFMNELGRDKKYQVDKDIIKCRNKVKSDCRKKIMRYIKSNKISYPDEAGKKFIDIMQLDYAPYSKYNARNLDTYVYLLYLLGKYSEIGIPRGKSAEKIVIKQSKNKNVYFKLRNGILYITTLIPELYHLEIHWHSKDLYYIPKNLLQAINKSAKRNKRFIVMFVNIVNTDINHLNILILDTKNKSIERFDPYGNIRINKIGQLDDILEKLFKKYKYVRPREYLNVIGLQTLSDEENIFNKKTGDPSGYCVAWCCWYLELRVRNIELSPKKLIEKAIHNILKSELTFMEYIRNYANHLTNQRNLFLLKAGIDKKNLYNVVYNKKNLTKIYDQYKKDLDK